jgi:hypothetical protein
MELARNQQRRHRRLDGIKAELAAKNASLSEARARIAKYDEQIRVLAAEADAFQLLRAQIAMVDAEIRRLATEES